MRRLLLLALPFIASGCASMPDLTLPYYLPQTFLQIKVTQTGACGEGKTPVLTTNVSFTPIYTQGKAEFFEYADLGRGLTKADATLEFFHDGRIKSINSTQTGQVGEAVSSIISIAGTLALDYSPDDVAPACDYLNSLVGAGKPLTIIYTGDTRFDQDSAIKLVQFSVSDTTLAKVRPIFGWQSAEYVLPNQSISTPFVKQYDGPSITLREPAEVKASVYITRGRNVAHFEERIWVGQLGKEYELPLQRSPWFGENSMQLVLTEAGRIAKLRYAGGDTAAGVLGAIDTTAKGLQGDGPGARAATLKSEADLIYQQQRLIVCQTDPDNCPK